MEKVKVEMCLHYTWDKGPKCRKGHRAGIKCHSERLDCPDYNPSWGYPSHALMEKGGRR